MNSDKLNLIKKIIGQQLSSFDFDKEINDYQVMLSDIRSTPADEFSLSGNIEYGISNLLESATGVSHTIGFLTAKKTILEELLNLINEDINGLNEILKPNTEEEDSSWKDRFLENIKTKKDSNKKHFFDCTLTDEDWGSENCICPGAYIYRKYLSIGLSDNEARLISDYTELGNLMEDKERLAKGKALYEKHRFFNASDLKSDASSQ